jgi:hypothetical protein
MDTFYLTLSEFLMDCGLKKKSSDIILKIKDPMIRKDAYIKLIEVLIKKSRKEESIRIASKLKGFTQWRAYLKIYKFSSFRLNYLKKTIDFLSKHGKVYLVRLPIHPEMLKIENELMPNFEGIINEVAPLTNGYLNMTPDNHLYKCTDGNHLYKESGKEVSEKIALWIKNKQLAPNNL